MASIFVGFGASPRYVGEAKTKNMIIAPTTQVKLAAGPTPAALTKKPKDAELIPRAKTTRLPIWNAQDTETNKFAPASPSGYSQTNKITGTIEAGATGTSELEVHGGAEIKD